MRIRFIIPVLILMIPSVVADFHQDEVYPITGGFGATHTVYAHHTGPDTDARMDKDGRFYIKLNVLSEDDTFDVDVSLYQLHGGCIENHRHYNVTSDQSVTLAVNINMNGASTCNWHLIGTVYDAGTTTIVHQFQMTGTVTSDAPTHYWAWTAGFFVLLMFTLWVGSSMVWLVPAGAATIGVMGQQYTTFPVGPVGALFLYIMGIWLVWWTGRVKEKKEGSE